MSFCTNCGAQLMDNAKFCNYCGQAVNDVPTEQIPETPAEVPSFTTPTDPEASISPEVPAVSAAPADDETGYSYNYPTWETASESSVPQYNTTGLMIWSVLSLLFGALIFGIVALVNTLQINKCATVEEQQKKIKSARTWCIVSTVIGVLAIFARMAQG